MGLAVPACQPITGRAEAHTCMSVCKSRNGCCWDFIDTAIDTDVAFQYLILINTLIDTALHNLVQKI